MSTTHERPRPSPHEPLSTPDHPTAATRTSRGGLFRAFWRWHFYASLLVAPVLLLLATTGLIYLFRFQLEPLLHPDLMRVSTPTVSDAVARPAADQLAAVVTAYPDAAVMSVTEPSTRTDPTRFSLTLPNGAAQDVFVNPWTGRVLGDLDPDGTLSGTAIRLHGELMVGPVGDAVIELGACWAIVMALSGYYLFWRGRAARARRRSAKVDGAGLRSRHAVTGVFVGVGLLLLVITGLPWTGTWGSQVQKLATAGDTSLWSDDHGALSQPTSVLDESLPHSHDVPWAQGKSPVPTSGDAAGGRSVATVDTALVVGARAGLAHPMTVALPQSETGVFSVIGYAFTDPGAERTVHVDRYGGAIRSTYGYADYPVLAKVVSQGISVHEGRRFGTVTMALTTLFCLAVVFMCVTGPLMWWRRRPRGSDRLGAPRGRLPLRTTPLLAVGLCVLAVLLPMFGASLVLVLALDRLVLRRLPATRRWFDVA